jgi:hypothetical protein
MQYSSKLLLNVYTKENEAEVYYIIVALMKHVLL